MSVDPKTASHGTIVFDLDGTLCTNTFGEYGGAVPHGWAIERLNALADAGYRIVILTARGSATGIDWERHTHEQLTRWGVRYDELRLGKPSGDVYVDDRAVHSDDWRRSDAFLPPGHPLSAGTGLPPAPPAHLTAIAEIGRTFGGEPMRVAEHAARAARLADAAGIAGAPRGDRIAELAAAALGAADVPSGDDVVYSISIAAGAHAAYLDAWSDAPAAAPGPAVRVSRRPLREAASALRVPLTATKDGPPTVRAATASKGAEQSWPLRAGSDGYAGSALGGVLAVVRNGELTISPQDPPDVACHWLAELAESAGIGFRTAPVPVEELQTCEEAAIVGVPFCLLRIESIDGRGLEVKPGSLCSALVRLWSESAGLDLDTQLAGLRGKR